MTLTKTFDRPPNRPEEGQKTLSAFIARNMEQLLEEWEEFARSAKPVGVVLNHQEFRIWPGAILKAIAEEMTSPQSDAELERKSKRLRPSDTPDLTKVAQTHVVDRLSQGVTLDQMVLEYRALRTSVALLWRQHAGTRDDHLEQLVRFDEALDQALSECVKQYTSAVERARDLFAAALGHDLRSPLGSILTTAEALLLSSDQLPSHYVQGAARIRNSTIRIKQMVHDLLDFTHTRLGSRLRITREETDLADICATILDEVRVTHPDRDIRLNCHHNLVGSFDANRIGQMLTNLIDNAVKYGRRGFPTTVDARSTDGEVIITVHNEGEPIPKEMWRAIFEPLVRGSFAEGKPEGGQAKPVQSRAGEGLGLGLYIAKQIAKAHGGRIHLQSTTSDGTTFEVRLPRDP